MSGTLRTRSIPRNLWEVNQSAIGTTILNDRDGIYGARPSNNPIGRRFDFEEPRFGQTEFNDGRSQACMRLVFFFTSAPHTVNRVRTSSTNPPFPVTTKTGV